MQPLSLKTRQVAGVTLIVGISVVALSAVMLAFIARFSLEETASRGELLARTVFQQATSVARPADPYNALRTDPGIRSILESGIAFSPNVTYVAIADTKGVAIAHSSKVLEGQRLPDEPDLRTLTRLGPLSHIRAVYSARTYEVRERMLMGTEEFGTIRVGLSMLLVRDEIEKALAPATAIAVFALLISSLVAMAFAQWMLQPIHLLRSGLTRLGRGEFDVKLDLPGGEEFADLGRSFEHVSAELSAARTQLAGQPAPFESLADQLEDEVMMVSPAGDLLFANAAMRRAFPALPNRRPVLDAMAPPHPYRGVLERALETRASQAPRAVRLTGADGSEVEHLVSAHTIEGVEGRLVGVMLVSRNVAYLTQVQSTLTYSRKLAALGRLLAGVAHEVKNPLNAMTIHLELLKQKLSGGSRRRAALASAAAGAGRNSVAADVATPAPPAAPSVDPAAVLHHANIIGQEIRRLDEVVQGFLRFSRPEEIRLQPVQLPPLVDDVASVIGPDAEAHGVVVNNECPPDLPPVSGDSGMLRQALLNLALNALQAMPDGGTLCFAGRTRRGQIVELSVEDTGVGIEQEHLGRIFDLYFTTREGGSGIGLSMVYRTVQLHDGTIEVESTPGAGTTFRLALPRA